MNNNLDFLMAIGRAGNAEISIAGTGLELAALDRDRPNLDRYRHHLDLLATDVARAGINLVTAEDRAAALCESLWRVHGYTGDKETYDNIENANLMSVIDRRKGLPVALSILYMHAGRAQGWPVVGLNFPGHFLIRVEGEADRVILDPFKDGDITNPADLRGLLKRMVGEEAELDPSFYQSVSDRMVLVRLQNNIRLRALKLGDIPQAVKVLYRLVLLDPAQVEFWYELGMLEVHLDHLRPGRDALEKCLMLIDHFPGHLDLKERIMETLNEISSATD